jgi:hypothetical protein
LVSIGWKRRALEAEFKIHPNQYSKLLKSVMESDNVSKIYDKKTVKENR